MLNDLWPHWVKRWQYWEALARRRGWTVTPLQIEPPASTAQIKRIEAANDGMSIPPQLRALLEKSRRVHFGWVIPTHLQSMEWGDRPTASHGIGSLWDVNKMVESTGPSIVAMRSWIADEALSEKAESPDSGVGQFGVWTLPNGDLLTIDTLNTLGDSPDNVHQPVRYISHEFDMLHGCALSNDLFGFIDEMSKLGHTGTEWASWMGFGVEEEDHRLFRLQADTPGARKWIAWAESDPDTAAPPKPKRSAKNQETISKPPKVMLAKTEADRTMLLAARAGRFDHVFGAIEKGANVDACLDNQGRRAEKIYGEEFWTSLTYAVSHRDVEALKALLASGATLDTRVTPVSVAVSVAGPDMLKTLLDVGARVERWTGERHTPLYDFVNKRVRTLADTRDAYATQVKDQGIWQFLDAEEQKALYAKEAARHLTPAQYNTMLDMLLAAGADPNAVGDNGTTALFWARPETAQKLLANGADPNMRDASGSTPLHCARDAEKIRVLIAFGADPNAVADGDDLSYTPLQSCLLESYNENALAKARALIELGADPNIASRDGRSTLHWCTHVAALDLALSWGLEPHDRAADGSTLLHSLYKATSIRATFSKEVEMLDRILALGIDINATDHADQTVLHLATARIDQPDDIALLLNRGADPAARDAKNKLPFDYAPRSHKAVRALLRDVSK